MNVFKADKVRFRSYRLRSVWRFGIYESVPESVRYSPTQLISVYNFYDLLSCSEFDYTSFKSSMRKLQSTYPFVMFFETTAIALCIWMGTSKPKGTPVFILTGSAWLFRTRISFQNFVWTLKVSAKNPISRKLNNKTYTLIKYKRVRTRLNKPE